MCLFRHREEVLIADELRVNDRIRAREVRVVAPDGSQIGVKGIEEAKWLADQLGLDLVEVAPEARPPVVRLMDYGKYKYEQSVKAREARKRQTRTVIKEVKLRPKIDTHDFEVKRLRAERFLDEGDKVKVTMMFRGREVTHPDIGRDLLKRFSAELDGFCTVEQMPKLEGRNMTMVLAPVPRSKRRVDRNSDESDSAADDAAESETPAE